MTSSLSKRSFNGKTDVLIIGQSQRMAIGVPQVSPVTNRRTRFLWLAYETARGTRDLAKPVDLIP